MPSNLNLQLFLLGPALISALTLIALGAGLRWPAGELRSSLRAWFYSGLWFLAALIAWSLEARGWVAGTVPAAILLCGLAEAWHGQRLLAPWRPRPRWPYLLASGLAALGWLWPMPVLDSLAFLLLGLAAVPAALRALRLRTAPAAQLPRLLCAMLLLMALGAFYEAVARLDGHSLAQVEPWSRMLGFWLLAAAPLTLPLLFALALVERLERRLLETSLSDVLTGLPNRRAMLGALERALAGARRRQAPLALLVLDIDHFSAFNQRLGEDVGDLALRGIGRRLADLVRGEDTLARIGGEEFGVLLPGCSPEKAIEVAERMRGSVASEPAARTEEWLTVSVGVVSALAGEGTPALLLEAAERQMKVAKSKGRDRVAADHGVELPPGPGIS